MQPSGSPEDRRWAGFQLLSAGPRLAPAFFVVQVFEAKGIGSIPYSTLEHSLQPFFLHFFLINERLFFFSQNKTWKPLEVQYNYYLFSTIVINGVADFSRPYLDPPRCAKYISLGPFLHSALTSLCGAGINYLDFTDEETDGWESGEGH